FFSGDRLVLEAENPAADLSKHLEAFSERTDTHGGVRTLTHYALLFGFPLFLYLAGFAMVEGVLLCLRVPGATAAAAVACLAIGLLALVPVTRVAADFQAGEAPALAAKDSPARLVAGIKGYVENNQTICSLGFYHALVAHPDPAVRYWTARALRTSPCPQTLDDLVALAGDPHRNVQCKALESLGYRGGPRARDTVLHVLRASDDWYVQMYAYRAARRLGWRQEW
ncbi:MAG: HEAT repeat domain-containing protein, partial [Deltaproteobacteria bacterium]|nr:HEAT repeat domain-containing protein [Deltaproteobacteria bacterium]